MIRIRVYEHMEGTEAGTFDYQLISVGNNEILCSSLQGYENLGDCVATVTMIAQTAADAPIEYDLVTVEPPQWGEADEETSEHVVDPE